MKRGLPFPIQARPVMPQPELDTLLFEPGAPAAQERRGLLGRGKNAAAGKRVRAEKDQRPMLPLTVIWLTPLRALASLLAEGADDPKALEVPIEPGQASQVLVQAVRTNIAIWKLSGKVLSLGRDRSYPANKPPPLPPKSAVLKTAGGIWYIDGAMNTVGLIRSHAPHAERVAKGGRPRAGDRRAAGLVPDLNRAIVDRPMTPVLRLGRLDCPDENGRPRPVPPEVQP